MSEGRIKILEMLQEGKITVDEAMAMLAQFPEEEQAQNQTNNNHDNNNDSRKEREYTASFDFADVGNTIKGAISNALSALDDIDIQIEIGGGKKYHMNFESEPITDTAIPSLRLLGKNAPVTIHGYEGSTIQINTKYATKSRGATLHVQEQNGNYELLYDYNAVRSVAVECYVPRHILIQQLHGESKNSALELYDVQAGHVELLTKNSKISLESVTAPNIVARTKNSNIEARYINTAHLDLETSNSKIEIEEVVAKIARLTTSNAKISTESINIQQLYMKTSNAGIKVEEALNFTNDETTPEFGSQQRPEGILLAERVIEAHTSNGTVQIYVPDDVAVKLQASTSNGRIDSTLTNLIAHEISKNYLHATSQNYDTAQKRARIDIKTSNSSVKIKQED